MKSEVQGRLGFMVGQGGVGAKRDYGMMRCEDCGEEIRRTGTNHKRCEECAKKRRKEYEQSPEYKAAQKKYNQSPEYKAAQKKRRLKREYDITLDQYNEMLDAQDGRCAVCGIVFVGTKPPHIDHDHVTLKVRGLLCAQCNSGLGQFKDSPIILRRALAYLAKHAAEGERNRRLT